MVDALVLGTSTERCEGSSPFPGTIRTDETNGIIFLVNTFEYYYTPDYFLLKLNCKSKVLLKSTQ